MPDGHCSRMVADSSTAVAKFPFGEELPVIHPRFAAS